MLTFPDEIEHWLRTTPTSPGIQRDTLELDWPLEHARRVLNALFRGPGDQIIDYLHYMH